MVLLEVIAKTNPFKKRKKPSFFDGFFSLDNRFFIVYNKGKD